MNNINSIKLKQDFRSRSDFVQFIDKYLCSKWGINKTPQTVEGKIIGATSPLWTNPNSLFYKINAVVLFIITLLFIAFYVFLRYFNNSNELSGLSVRDYSLLPPDITYDDFMSNTQKTNSTEVTAYDAYCMYRSYYELNTAFVLIGAIVLFSNFFHCLYLGYILDYASDSEWSRHLIANFAIWVLLVGITIGDYVYSSKLINFYNNHHDENQIRIFSSKSPFCNKLFEINMYGYLIVAIVMSLIAIIQIWKIFTIWKKFFVNNYVDHSARCEDDNIIVIN